MKINWSRVIIAVCLIALSVYGMTMLFRRYAAPDVSNGTCVFVAIVFVSLLIEMFVNGIKVKED